MSQVMTSPDDWTPGETSGAELAAAIRRRAAALDQSLYECARALSPNPGQFVKYLERARTPRPDTIERVRAWMLGLPVPPPAPSNFQKAARPYAASFSRADRDPQRSGPVPTPVDRDPCFHCGTRADLGCRHQRYLR